MKRITSTHRTSWMVRPLLIAKVLVMFSLAGLVAADSTVAGRASADVDTAKVKPAMRSVDRDWQFFKSISCDDLHRIVHHSRSEEILLAKRKSQCVNRYRAFFADPVDQ